MKTLCTVISFVPTFPPMFLVAPLFNLCSRPGFRLSAFRAISGLILLLMLVALSPAFSFSKEKVDIEKNLVLLSNQ